MPFPISTLIIIGAIIIGFWILLFIFPISLWITAIFTGGRVNLIELVLMRIRKVPPALIVKSMILATKAGTKRCDNPFTRNVRSSAKAILLTL